MYNKHILLCAGTGCNSYDVYNALSTEIIAQMLKNEVQVVKTGCFGLCEKGPIMIIYPEGRAYTKVKVEDVPEIVAQLK